MRKSNYVQETLKRLIDRRGVSVRNAEGQIVGASLRMDFLDSPGVVCDVGDDEVSVLTTGCMCVVVYGQNDCNDDKNNSAHYDFHKRLMNIVFCFLLARAINHPAMFVCQYMYSELLLYFVLINVCLFQVSTVLKVVVRAE
jgi:hypothetical protein